MSELHHQHDQTVSRFKFTGEDPLFPGMFDGDTDGIDAAGIKLNRRQFMQVSGGAAAWALLSACGVSPTPAPTEIASPVQSPTATPRVETPTPQPPTPKPTDAATNAPEPTKVVEAAPINGLNHADAQKVAADRVAQVSKERGKPVTLEDLMKEHQQKFGTTTAQAIANSGDWYAYRTRIENPLLLGSYEKTTEVGTETFIVIGYPDKSGITQVIPVLIGVSDGKNAFFVPSFNADTPELKTAADKVPLFQEKVKFMKWLSDAVINGGIKSIGIDLALSEKDRNAKFGGDDTPYWKPSIMRKFISLSNYYSARLSADKKNWGPVDPGNPNLVDLVKFLWEQIQSKKTVNEPGLTVDNLSVR